MKAFPPRPFRGLPAAIVLLAAGCAAPSTVALQEARWEERPTGTSASLRGLCPVSQSVCWAAGSGGTVLRTVDGGESWTRHPVPDGASLDFRDVHAFDRDTAVLLNAGAPARIHRTEDGGRTWQKVYEDNDPAAFLDGLCFDDPFRGFAFGDPHDGAFVVLVTTDGGRSWERLPREAVPAPAPGEAGFAASGTNLCAEGGALWIATGGFAARCLRRAATGHWTVAPLPLRQGAPSQGAFSIAMRGARGVAVGGDYLEPQSDVGTAAWSDDGGRHWRPAMTGPGGYRSAVAFLADGRTCIAVGEGGASWSADGGAHWRPLPGPGFHSVAVAADGAVWAAGAGGRVAVLR